MEFVYRNTDSVVDETVVRAPPPVTAWQGHNQNQIFDSGRNRHRHSPIRLQPAVGDQRPTALLNRVDDNII